MYRGINTILILHLFFHSNKHTHSHLDHDGTFCGYKWSNLSVVKTQHFLGIGNHAKNDSNIIWCRHILLTVVSFHPCNLVPTCQFEIKNYPLCVVFYPESEFGKEGNLCHWLRNTMTLLNKTASQTFIPSREVSLTKMESLADQDTI